MLKVCAQVCGGPTSAGMARRLPEPSLPSYISPICYALMFVGANIDSSSVFFFFSLNAAFPQGHGHRGDPNTGKQNTFQ